MGRVGPSGLLFLSASAGAVLWGGEAHADLARGHRAFRAGEYAEAARELASAAAKGKGARDYALYMLAESTFYSEGPVKALRHFDELGKLRGSRFERIASWRLADCLWASGRRSEAGAAYRRVVKAGGGDAALARFRLAEIAPPEEARALYRAVHLEHPSHPLAAEAGRRAGGAAEPGKAAAPVATTPRDRLKRAATLAEGKHLAEARAELEGMSDLPRDLRAERDYELGMVIYKSRRDYAGASSLLLAAAPQLSGEKAAAAAFHGARALSRADRDDEAIAGYKRVVEQYPTSRWAAEAQFLSGWLDFNRGRFREGLPALEATLARHGRSAFANDAAWYVAFSHYLLGNAAAALPALEQYQRLSGANAEIGQRVAYWRGRILEKLGRADEGKGALRDLVARAPLTYYGTLARAQLRAAGASVELALPRRDPGFGKAKPALAREPAVARAEELYRAGLVPEAGVELRRAEEALEKKHGRDATLPLFLERYPRMQAYRRAYELAEGRAGAVLATAPSGPARLAWEAAYPRAYRAHVEKYAPDAGAPETLVYTIMQKETRYAPHEVSYADARGLLQLIPDRGAAVARQLGIEFFGDQLFDPETNIRLASAYIGGLYKTFGKQVFLAAGAYNAGAGPVMRWLDQHGTRPLDEFIELVAYDQTREYMKRVVGIYARYRYLYGEAYELPLTVDARYQKQAL